MNALAALLAHANIWRGDQLSRVASASVPTGFPALDAELPGGGWPTAALTEILPQHEGIGELRILGAALAALSAQQRTLVWIAPPHPPYAPALAALGIDLARLIIVTTRSPKETLWATEQALRSQACGAVLAWPGAIKYPELRRLQLAAEGNPVLAVLFRLPQAALETSCAALRLQLKTWHGGLAVCLLKRRGAALHAPILLHSPAVIPRRALKPWNHHAVDRPRLPLPAARHVRATVGAH
ncbi:MAG: translesion DNA synthesis-associated protein ImuA [Betaproteobacteria bacterium]